MHEYLYRIEAKLDVHFDDMVSIIVQKINQF